MVQPVPEDGQNPAWQLELPATSLAEMGFEEDQALLPYTDVSFQGYRYLQEYFAFPQRFLLLLLLICEVNGKNRRYSIDGRNQIPKRHAGASFLSGVALSR